MKKELSKSLKLVANCVYWSYSYGNGNYWIGSPRILLTTMIALYLGTVPRYGQELLISFPGPKMGSTFGHIMNDLKPLEREDIFYLPSLIHFHLRSPTAGPIHTLLITVEFGINISQKKEGFGSGASRGRCAYLFQCVSSVNDDLAPLILACR
ncbi:hypothetical protein BJ165DRAFT_1000826 [Panaeolus papilionaceus]|nr:hypothetical protein BJ165DRAFT_1000826 [Panaeolus papilionaceus]